MCKRVKNGGAIPGCHQLQDKYLPDVYTAERARLKELSHGQKIAVIFDEMSDDEGRFVLNILFAPLTENSDGRVISYLAATEFLPRTNHSTVSQAVIKALQSYEIDFDDVVVFDTDNAAYMKKAYTTVLSALFSQLRSCNMFGTYY